MSTFASTASGTALDRAKILLRRQFNALWIGDPNHARLSEWDAFCDALVDAAVERIAGELRPRAGAGWHHCERHEIHYFGTDWPTCVEAGVTRCARCDSDGPLHEGADAMGLRLCHSCWPHRHLACVCCRNIGYDHVGGLCLRCVRIGCRPRCRADLPPTFDEFINECATDCVNAR